MELLSQTEEEHAAYPRVILTHQLEIAYDTQSARKREIEPCSRIQIIPIPLVASCSTYGRDVIRQRRDRGTAAT